MILLSRQEAKDLDIYISEKIGIPLDILAERAGLAAAARCRELLGEKIEKSKVDVFAGKGRNGIDSLICARELSSFGADVRIWLLDSETEKTWQYKACVEMGLNINYSRIYSYRSPDMVIDGIFGISFDPNRILSDKIRAALDNVNDAGNKGSLIVSIDIPSGVCADDGSVIESAVKADETITFFSSKVGIVTYPGRNNCGRIAVSNLGISERIIEGSGISDFPYRALDKKMVSKMLPKRKTDGHKGTFGTVAVMGGSDGMAGACCLCAKSAYMSGTGLVYMAVPESIRTDCLKVVPEALAFTSVNDFPSDPDVYVIGPGGSLDGAFSETVIKAISVYDKLVLDARALRIMGEQRTRVIDHLLRRKNEGKRYPVLTPHPGELKDLLPGMDISNRIWAAREAAKIYNSICVLKGAGTVIAHPDGRAFINTTGNSSMAKGGSGDILAGIIGGILAQGTDSFDAACCGVYIHGLCGDISANIKTEYSAIPEDFIQAIPKAFTEMEKNG